MAQREIVTIFCDGPCGGNEIPSDYDAEWVLSPSTRKYRSVDLCADCSAPLSALYGKGASNIQRSRVTARTAEVRAVRDTEYQQEYDARFPAPTSPPPGMTIVSPASTPITEPLAADVAVAVVADDDGVVPYAAAPLEAS